MKKYTILFLLAFLTGPAFGQIMKGFVYDKETNEPLAGVNITYKRITGDVYKRQGVDRALRETPEKFEWFRANYHHPREFAAYTVKNATTEERELFDKLGFK